MSVSIVNRGAILNLAAGSVTTLSPALPASIVAGNLLLAFGGFQGGTSTTSTLSGAGWTAGGAILTNSTVRTSWAWKIATGSDVSPTWTRNGNNASRAGQIFQISGVTASPIGTSAMVVAGGRPVTLAALRTTAANSMLFYLGVSAATIGLTPTDFSLFSQDNAPNAGLFYEADTLTIPASGGSNTAYSGGGSGGSSWLNACIEILASAPPITPLNQGVIIW